MTKLNTLKVTGIINGYLVNYSYELMDFNREFNFFNNAILGSIEEALAYRVASKLNNTGYDGFNVTTVSRENNAVVGVVYDRKFFEMEEDDYFMTYADDLEYYFEDDEEMLIAMLRKINKAITKAYNNIVKELEV